MKNNTSLRLSLCVADCCCDNVSVEFSVSGMQSLLVPADVEVRMDKWGAHEASVILNCSSLLVSPTVADWAHIHQIISQHIFVFTFVSPGNAAEASCFHAGLFFFFLDRILFYFFINLNPGMFSLCALPLFWERKSDWLGGTDDCSSLGWSQSLLRFCNSRSMVEGRVKGVVPSPKGTNHSGRQAKHLSCRALIKDLAMYLPYFFTTFIQQ